MEESENMHYIVELRTYYVTIHSTKASKSIVQRGSVFEYLRFEVKFVGRAIFIGGANLQGTFLVNTKFAL